MRLNDGGSGGRDKYMRLDGGGGDRDK